MLERSSLHPSHQNLRLTGSAAPWKVHPQLILRMRRGRVSRSRNRHSAAASTLQSLRLSMFRILYEGTGLADIARCCLFRRVCFCSSVKIKHPSFHEKPLAKPEKGKPEVPFRISNPPSAATALGTQHWKTKVGSTRHGALVLLRLGRCVDAASGWPHRLSNTHRCLASTRHSQHLVDFFVASLFRRKPRLSFISDVEWNTCS